MIKHKEESQAKANFFHSVVETELKQDPILLKKKEIASA